MRKYRNHWFLFGLILGLAVWMQAPVVSAEKTSTANDCKCTKCTNCASSKTLVACPNGNCPVQVVTELAPPPPPPTGGNPPLMPLPWVEQILEKISDLNAFQDSLVNVLNDEQALPKLLGKNRKNGNTLSQSEKLLVNILNDDKKFKDAGLAQFTIQERLLILGNSLAEFSKQSQFQPNLNKLHESLKAPMLLNQPQFHQPMVPLHQPMTPLHQPMAPLHQPMAPSGQ